MGSREVVVNPIFINEAKERSLRDDIDNLTREFIMNAPLDGYRVKNIKYDWKDFMPTLAQWYSEEEDLSEHSIYVGSITGNKSFILHFGPNSNLLYNTDRTILRRPSKDEGSQGLKIVKNDEPIGEQIRLQMIKEILEFTLNRMQSDKFLDISNPWHSDSTEERRTSHYHRFLDPEEK